MPSTEGPTIRVQKGREPKAEIAGGSRLEVFPMDRPDPYLAVVVAILFLAGDLSIVLWARQRFRTRQRWSGTPYTHRNHAA